MNFGFPKNFLQNEVRYIQFPMNSTKTNCKESGCYRIKFKFNSKYAASANNGTTVKNPTGLRTAQVNTTEKILQYIAKKQAEGATFLVDNMSRNVYYIYKASGEDGKFLNNSRFTKIVKSLITTNSALSSPNLFRVNNKNIPKILLNFKTRYVNKKPV